MIKVGIVGGTGYTGVELLRLLATHPDVELTAITSRKEDGLPVADMYPSLRGHVKLAFTSPDKRIWHSATWSSLPPRMAWPWRKRQPCWPPA